MRKGLLFAVLSMASIAYINQRPAYDAPFVYTGGIGKSRKKVNYYKSGKLTKKQVKARAKTQAQRKARRLNRKD